VLPEVSVRPSALVEAGLVLAALGGGLHFFMRWLWPRLRAQEQDTGPWPVRWSVSILSLLVLLFLATMATVGIGHQVGWLASGQAPLLRTVGGFEPRPHSLSPQLCDEALRLSKDGVGDADIGSTLLAEAYTRGMMERLALLPMRKPGGEVAFLVIPRDPVIFQENGLVRCRPDHRNESFKATVLPQLLAGEELAGETGF
jgi:hypothetical protein